MGSKATQFHYGIWHVGRALCPKGLLSAVALASLVTERIIHLRCFLEGPVSAGLSWHAEIPRCCFVLYSLSFAAGFFLLPRRFSLPVLTVGDPMFIVFYHV